MEKLKLSTNYSKLMMLSIFYISIFGFVYGQNPTKTSNPSDQWIIKWSASDEFNSSNPDWSKWIKTGNLPNTTAWKWDNGKNVKINNGVAELTIRQNTNNASDGGTYFKSGILKSYNTFTYGYFEAKIKGADIGEGVCPAFWLYSNFDYSVGEGQTVYSEIDIVELQQFDWYEGHQDDIQDMDLNLHAVVKENGQGVWRRPKQYPEAQLNKWRASWDPRNDFHIYGCEVNEQEIIWYVDGIEVARKPNTYWKRPMNVTLSLGLRKPFVEFYNNRNNAVNPETDPEAAAKLPGMPTTMYVDYVRVWEKSTNQTPPNTEVGVLKNKGFETGDLTNWDASSGAFSVVNNNVKSGSYAGSINNASIAQIVILKANTTYTISTSGKVASAGTSAFLGISKNNTNEFVSNYEFNQTTYSKGEITITTGNTQEAYRIWFWSSGQAYCDDFDLIETNDNNSGEQDINVTGVSLNKSSINLNEGASTTLTATVLPANASNKAITWSVGNNTIASVDNNGKITALKAGSTTITVTTQDDGKTASATLTVSATNSGGTGELPEVGQTIWLKSSEGKYLTVNTGSGTAIQATKNTVSTKEEFIVVDANGYLGLKSADTDRYVTTASDASIKCGATGVFERQKYTIESNGSNDIYIKSKINNNYWVVNTSNSNKNIVASASSKGNASIFNWETSTSSSKTYTTQKNNSTLSIKDTEIANTELENKISIYPNPYSKGALTIDFSKKFSGKLKISDLNGRVVLELNISNKESFSLSESNLGLESGLYIIQLTSKGLNKTKKLLIQ